MVEKIKISFPVTEYYEKIMLLFECFESEIHETIRNEKEYILIVNVELEQNKKEMYLLLKVLSAFEKYHNTKIFTITKLNIYEFYIYENNGKLIERFLKKNKIVYKKRCYNFTKNQFFSIKTNQKTIKKLLAYKEKIENKK